MSERLEVRLFGRLLIQRNGELVTKLVSRKTGALVVYLARNLQPQAREVLASLLWDARDQTQAAGNLRVALSSIRDELGELVLSNRQIVEINPTAEVWVDANVLEERLSFLTKRTSSQKSLSPAEVLGLEQGLALYQGEFLAGFSPRDADLFDGWVRQERERFQILVQEGLDALVTHYLSVGQYTAGIEWAQRWLQIDSLNENALRQLLRLLGSNGQRNLAIQQFSDFQRRMIDELGVDPSPETLALYERLLDTELDLRQSVATLPAPAPPAIDLRPPLLHNLPSALLTIVGREQELDQIEDRLLGPACRLLTLIGIGGIGKTRLALEAAQRLLHLPGARTLFADGIYFVRLERIFQGELLPSIIAEALNFQFHGRSEPSDQLLAYLRNKQLLLVMDNFEHLVDQSDLVLDILQQAPQVKVLATSRERLNFAGEWLIDVYGLPYWSPATPAAGPLSLPAMQTTDPLSSPAAQFFVRCATAGQPGFTPASQLAAIAELCQLLDGSPLGLLLAAAAVRTHSCQQIVAEIKRNLDFLAVQMRNLPERHRTLRAVFDHSWALLTPAEQQALPRLAIFAEGFTVEAASQITGVTPQLLQNLAEKSLLQHGGIPVELTVTSWKSGYKFHRTLYPFVLEKLQADPALFTELRQRHCLYFANFVATQAAAFKGIGAVQATAALALELENIRASWFYAANHLLLDCLAQSLEGLAQFYLVRGPLSEGQTALQAASAEIRRHFADQLPTAPQAQRLLGHLTAEVAHFYNELGLFAEAVAAAQEALALALPDDSENQARAYLRWGAALHLQAQYADAQAVLERALQLAPLNQLPSLNAQARLWLGKSLMYQGNYPAGRHQVEQAVVIYQQLDNLYNELDANNSLAMVDFFSGDYSAAKATYERCLASARSLQDERSLGRALNNLGALSSHLGEYAQAQAYYQEALALKRAIGDRPIVGLILANLSLLTNRMNEYQLALQYSREALTLSQELGERDTQAYAYFCMGQAFSSLGDLAAAAAAYRQALALRNQLGQQNQALEPLAGLAHLYLTVGDRVEAQKLVEQILPHLQEDALAGIVELIRLYLTCYHVLQAQQDARAGAVLVDGARILQARAANISDPAARRSYLHNVTAHRELLAEYQQATSTPGQK